MELEVAGLTGAARGALDAGISRRLRASTLLAHSWRGWWRWGPYSALL